MFYQRPFDKDKLAEKITAANLGLPNEHIRKIVNDAPYGIHELIADDVITFEMFLVIDDLYKQEIDREHRKQEITGEHHG